MQKVLTDTASVSTNIRAANILCKTLVTDTVINSQHQHKHTRAAKTHTLQKLVTGTDINSTSIKHTRSADSSGVQNW